MKYFSLNKSALAGRIFSALKVSTENDKYLTIDKFSDGELLPIFKERSIRYEELFIIADGNTSEDIMKLFLTVDAAKRSGASAINVIYPYKHTPLNSYLFESLLRTIGVKRLMTTELDRDNVKGFHTTNLGDHTKASFAEYVSLLDKRVDVSGELFYSINRSPLVTAIYNTIQYYSGTDEYLTITKNDNGTYCPLFANNLKDKDVFLIADGHHSEDIMKLLATINVAKLSGARSITLVYPYAPYSRQDKNDHVRSSIGAKLIADILQAAGVTQLLTIELHSGAIQGFYNIPIIHMAGNKIFSKFAKAQNIPNITSCPPDQGATKRNNDFVKAFPDALAALIDKKRTKPNEIASMTITGEENIPGRNVISVDDMGDTLGTLCKAGDLVMSYGAETFRAYLTHPVFSGKWMQNLYNSQITELIVSDTVSGVYRKLEDYNRYNDLFEEYGIKIPKIIVISSAELLSGSIDRLIKHESINELNVA